MLDVPAKLPDKPSELIRVALADLEKCEKDPGYKIEMDVWHEPRSEGGKCEVCLAGSVMAKTLSVDRIMDADPSEFPEAVHLKLCALDSFRCGEVTEAFLGMRIGDGIRQISDREIKPYSLNPAQFKEDMNRLADELEAAGY